MKLVFATNNLNKLIEVKKVMPSFIELLSLKDINCFDKIKETAANLEGNAQIKADYISKKYGFDCFADDTGLEVKALNGAPGVHSARYASLTASTASNIQKLLKELEKHTDREAQFRSSICLKIGEKTYFFNGICKGLILNQIQGKKGFGYDSIFMPKGCDKSFAEMTLEEKNKISHRGLALKKLINFLKIGLIKN
ncbi:MAG: non-canonical purine NTP diphosphatase [Tenacibaculum sp.]